MSTKKEPPWAPKLWAFEEFVNHPVKAGAWLIPRLVPAESIIWLSGLPKQGFKTWLALWLSMMVAGKRSYTSPQGCTWARPPLGGKVLIFEDEGSHLASKERLNKVALGLGAPIEVERQLLPLPAGMEPNDPDRPYDWRTKLLKPDPLFDNLIISHADNVKLDIPERRDILLGLVRQHKPALVVFDPWTYVLSGDENEKRDVALGVDAVKQIRKEGCTVMSLVHLKKDGGDEPDIDKDMRGHTLLRDTYDLHLGCRRPKDRDVVVLHCRYRDFSKPKKFEMFWHIPDAEKMGPVVLDLKEVSKGKASLEGKTPADFVKMLLDAGFIRGVGYPASRLNEIWKANPGRATEVRGELVSAGLLQQKPDGKFVIPKEDDDGREDPSTDTAAAS